MLDKLGAITAIRDTEMLEQSLLKALVSVLGVHDVALYKTTLDGLCVQVVHQHRKITVDDLGLERVTESTDTRFNRIEVPPEAEALMNHVRLTGKPSHWRQPTGHLAVYPLAMVNHLDGFVVFQLPHEVNDAENAVVSGILQVYSNYYRLLDDSQRDRLTGLYNRHALDLNIDRLWPLLRQGQTDRTAPPEASPCCWLALLDIDRFKDVNDHHGHVLGDEVLLLMSRLIAGALRKNDLLYRYGGEEFLTITSAGAAEQVQEQFERVRQRVASHLFPQVGRLTLSIGFTRIDPHCSVQEIIGRADRALYQAKREGRDRVRDFEALARQGTLQPTRYGLAELL